VASSLKIHDKIAGENKERVKVMMIASIRKI
jgi:hypothetical protein